LHVEHTPLSHALPLQQSAPDEQVPPTGLQGFVQVPFVHSPSQQSAAPAQADPSDLQHAPLAQLLPSQQSPPLAHTPPKGLHGTAH
jgi:hypothetical protein